MQNPCADPCADPCIEQGAMHLSWLQLKTRMDCDRNSFCLLLSNMRRQGRTPRAMQMAFTAWLMQLLPMVSIAGAGLSLQVCASLPATLRGSLVPDTFTKPCAAPGSPAGGADAGGPPGSPGWTSCMERCCCAMAAAAAAAAAAWIAACVAASRPGDGAGAATGT